MRKNLILENAYGLEEETEVYEYIDSLPPGGVFYDLGACVGGFSLYACSKGLKTVSFEVDEENYLGMISNYNLNKKLFSSDHYFNPIQIGIADKKGKTFLRIGQPWVGGHHKTLDLEEYCASSGIIGEDKREVEVNSLDNIIIEMNLPFPDYMKVDIDGSEYSFIKGAKKTLSRVKSIIIELLSEEEVYFPKIIQELKDLGLEEIERAGTIPETEFGLRNIKFARRKNVD
jgi:FkbM family methyltransferase